MCPPSRLGAFGAATILALSAVACSPRARGDAPSAHPTAPDRPAVSPTLHPAWRPAASFPTRWPIKHVVFRIKENRTFDNLFSTFPGANGATRANDDGTIRPLTRGTDGRLPGGLSTRWAFTRLDRAQLPNYWHWARRFVLADNFFASAQGPSFPNHLYSIAAQSGRRRRQPQANRVLLQHLRMRRAFAAVGRGIRLGGPRPIHPPVLRLQDRGGPPGHRPHPMGVLRGHRVAAWIHLVGLLGDPTVPGAPSAMGAAHVLGGPGDPGHPSGRAATGHVDHASLRALGAPRIQLLPWRELEHEGDQRDHAVGHMGRHGDLPDVG